MSLTVEHTDLLITYKRMKESDSDIPDSSGSSSKRLRSSTEGMFNFREHCLFCGEECQFIPPQKNPNRWKEVYLVEQLTEKDRFHLKNLLLDMYIERRSDNWGNDVTFRAHSALSDLHARTKSDDDGHHRECVP